MRPARSRRVQAQRKFAQGAYVPPNVAAAAPADNRRDTAQDPSNVTRNSMTASNLLDVISLQGTSSTPERQSLLLTPVVLVERLRGKPVARTESPQSSSDSQPLLPARQEEKQPTPVEGPKLQTTKKTKEYKRVHAMSLRSRRLSKLQLNKKIALNSVASRKANKRRRRSSDDEDEPLIYQKNKMKAKSTLKRTTARVSAPLVGNLKPNIPLPNSTVKQSVPSNDPIVTTPDLSSPDRSPKKKHPKKSDQAKQQGSPKKQNLKKTPKQSSLDKFIKKNANNSRTLDTTSRMDTTLQRRSPVPAHVPHLSVDVEVKAVEMDPDESFDFDQTVTNRGSPVLRDVPVISGDHLGTDSTVPCVLDAADDLDIPSAPGTNVLDASLDQNIPSTLGPTVDPVIPSVQFISSTEECNEDEDFTLHYDESNRGEANVPANMVNGNDVTTTVDVAENQDDRPVFLEVVLPGPVVTSDMVLEEPVASTSGMQSSSPELRVLSPDSDLSDFEGTPNRLAQYLKLRRSKRRLAQAKRHNHRMRKDKEKQIARIEEEKRRVIAKLQAEKNMCVAEVAAYREKFNIMQHDKEREIARLKQELREDMRKEMEEERAMIAEVDAMAKALENEKDAKSMNPEELDLDEPGCSGSAPKKGGVVDAPVYHPTLMEFADPLIFYEKIFPEAVRFGICKIVPPIGWQPPPYKLNDEMRFDVTNQYISRLFARWGPAARELCAIKLCLQQQKIFITKLPCVDGVEISLPKLYHLVQRHGGLETVINKKRWGRVAEDMKFTRGPITERRLDQIYVKFLLPYDTLSHQERQEILMKVELAWQRKNQKLLDRAMNPLYRQKRMLGLQEESEEETEDPDTMVALQEAEDCIVKGTVMTLAKFKKVATMTYENTFGQGSESGTAPNTKDVEEEYWRLVTHAADHTCVNSAAIDTGEEGYGFPKNKDEPYGDHPWNPKMVSQNSRNVLSYLDSIIGLTIPTLLLGMLYSTSCWHKDPQGICWLEYQAQGPPRVWYAISEPMTKNFRKAVEILCPTSVQNKKLWLPSDISMIPPEMLREHNVTLSRVEQNSGEYIMVFPGAYTCCISTGYSVSESVYFAPPSWLKRLWTVFQETRESCEPTMFAMEHLLYNIARDAATADHEILQTAQPLFDRMLREEVTNRQMLQERGLSLKHELLSADAIPSTSSGKKKGKQYIPRDQEECEYCRATLYLSKVKGLTERNTFLCLEHALKVLESDKFKDVDVSDVQVLIQVSVKELYTVNDDMKRRLGIK